MKYLFSPNKLLLLLGIILVGGALLHFSQPEQLQGDVFMRRKEALRTPDEFFTLVKTRDEVVDFFDRWEQERDELVEQMKLSGELNHKYANRLYDVFRVMDEGTNPSLKEILRHTAKTCKYQRQEIDC